MISIIVTSYSMNRLNDISDLLRSIRNQTEKNYELVYVTEHDRNLQYAIEREAKELGLAARVIHNNNNPGLAEARNLGARMATGEIVAFVDDDVILDPSWSHAVEVTFRSYPSVVGMTGPAYPYWVGEQAEWLPTGLDWLIGCTRWFQSDATVEIRNCWGMNMAFRRSAFQTIGGFSERTGYHRGDMAEDLDFSLRIARGTGGKLLYVPQMLVQSKVYPFRISNRFVIDRSRWIGHSRRAIPKRIGGTAYTVEMTLAVSFARWVFIGGIFRGLSSISGLFRRCRLIALSLTSLVVGYLLDT